MLKISKTAIVTPALAALVIAMPLVAEPASDDPQPYAGLQTREVKALSDAQIDDYRNGRGMSLALAAELNGYPGPRHVLDLAEQLALTPAQRARAQAAFDAMRAEAVDLGEHIIARETALDRLFAEATVSSPVSPGAVESLALSIGALTGQLRFTHLRYHLDLRDMLNPDQVDAYEVLRGYQSAPAHDRRHIGH